MMGFALWVLPIVLLLIWVVRYRQSKPRSQDSVTNAIAIHKAQLAELESQYEQGQINHEEYDALKLEEVRALLADADHERAQTTKNAQLPWFWVPVLTLVVFAAAYLTYSVVGAAQAVNVKAQFDALRGAGQNLQPEQIQQALSSYQELLQQHPADTDGWFRLARMQMDMQQYDAAITSLQHLLVELRKVEHRVEDESTVLSFLGQSQLALGRFPEALASFQESLQYFQSDTALGLAGRVAFEMADFPQAIDYWTRLKLRHPEVDSTAVDQLIDRAKAQLAASGIDYEAAQPLNIVVHINLPAAWEGLPEQAALFVYARQPGQRMPLVVKRLPVTGPAMSVMLTDADAMGPMGGLTGQDVVEVTARVSLTGVANSQPGDWTADATTLPLEQKENVIQLTIEQP